MFMTVSVITILLALIAWNFKMAAQPIYKSNTTGGVVNLADEWKHAKDKFSVITPNTDFYVDVVITHIQKFHMIYNQSFFSDFDKFYVLVCHTRRIAKNAAEVRFRLPHDRDLQDMHARLTRKTLRFCIACMDDVIQRFRTSKWRVPPSLSRTAQIL